MIRAILVSSETDWFADMENWDFEDLVQLTVECQSQRDRFRAKCITMSTIPAMTQSTATRPRPNAAPRASAVLEAAGMMIPVNIAATGPITIRNAPVCNLPND